MKAIEIDDFTINKAHCDWIIENARELKALLSYKSRNMIVMNKTRAISSIDTMIESLNELKSFIDASDD